MMNRAILVLLFLLSALPFSLQAQMPDSIVRKLSGYIEAVQNFGEMLPGDVGLLVHGGVFQPPLVNEPQQPGGEAFTEIIHQAFQTAGCPGCRGGCRNCT